MVYEPRFYREWGGDTLETFSVAYRDTDLYIRAKQRLPDLCLSVIRELWRELEAYGSRQPSFLRSLLPLPVPVTSLAPDSVRTMCLAAERAGVGPMASVAGFFAERVGQAMLRHVDEVIVENGGDIYLSLKSDGVIGVFSGKKSPFSGKLGLRIRAADTPLGVCTSAGRVGPSRSFGSADAVTVIGASAVLADAAATAIGNRVQHIDDIEPALAWGQQIAGVRGVLILIEDRIGLWGDVDLVKTRVAE